MKQITANHFLRAFSGQWESARVKQGVGLEHLYGDTKAWTAFMLGEEGFLRDVMMQLQVQVPDLRYMREWYTVDALYVGGENLFRENLSYASKVHTLIEHERGEFVEEEMWKIVHWRSPLKVLIMYDYSDREKTTVLRREWLALKLRKLREMLAKVSEFHSESSETEYVFIVGRQVDLSSKIDWRWTSDTFAELLPISGNGSV